MPEQDPTKLTKQDIPSEELGTPFMLRRTKARDRRAIGNRQDILLGGHNVNSVSCDAETMSRSIATLPAVPIAPRDFDRSAVEDEAGLVNPSRTGRLDLLAAQGRLGPTLGRADRRRRRRGSLRRDGALLARDRRRGECLLLLLLGVGDGRLKLLDTLAEGTADLAQLARAEDDEDDGQNQQQMHRLKGTHKRHRILLGL